MKFIKKIEELDTVIVEYGTRMLAKHINGGDNDLIPLETYQHTIFNNIQVSGYATQYKIFNDVAVWLIDDLTDELYAETIKDYLHANKTDHGQQVYASYLKNQDYFHNEYFGTERDNIVGKTGLLFVLTEKTEKEEIIKICHFHPTNF